MLTLIPVGIVAIYPHQESYELRVELVSCRPDSLLNVYREKFWPLDFWVEQHVVLDPENMRDSSVCDDYPDEGEKLKCVYYFDRRIENVLACGELAWKMCRIHGGCKR